MRLLDSTDYALRVLMLLASAPAGARIASLRWPASWAGCRGTICTRSSRS